MDAALILVSGGAPSPSLVDDLPLAELVVAADGGYAHAAELGIAVDVVVGDFDSLDIDELPSHVIVERHPRDKDATDLELALELVARDRPERIIVLGGGGGRLDHEMAIAALLCAERWSDVDEIDWLSERGWTHVIRNRRSIHADIGSTLSLIPMGGTCRGISTTGLKWNLEDEELQLGTTRGVSNVMVSPVADIRVGEGCLLAVLPVT